MRCLGGLGGTRLVVWAAAAGDLVRAQLLDPNFPCSLGSPCLAGGRSGGAGGLWRGRGELRAAVEVQVWRRMVRWMIEIQQHDDTHGYEVPGYEKKDG